MTPCAYCGATTPRRLCYFHARTLIRLRGGRCIDCEAVLGSEDASWGRARDDGERGSAYCLPCRESRLTHGIPPDRIVRDYWNAEHRRRAAA